MNRLKQIGEWLWDERNAYPLVCLAMSLVAFRNLFLLGFFPLDQRGLFILAGFVGFVYFAAAMARKSWARWPGLACGLVVLSSILLQMYGRQQFRWFDAFQIVCLGFFIYYAFRADYARRDERSSIISLVLLLREPRHFDATILANLASRAWGVPIEPTETGDDDDDGRDDDCLNSESNGNEAENYLIGSSPIFIVKHPEGMFLIHDIPHPYFDDVEAVAADVKELRTRTAVLEHQAWLACDAMGCEPDTPEAQRAYQLIGKLLAEIADENVLAIIEPRGGVIDCYGPETEKRLLSEDPVAALQQYHFAPIIDVPDDDAAMAAAEEEARRRWPEFVEAFEARAAQASETIASGSASDSANDAPFLVKAPFREGDVCEFMWVTVEGIEGGTLYGTLENDPNALPSLRCGQRVQVAESDVNDWLCVIDGKPVGGFTMKILGKRLK